MKLKETGNYRGLSTRPDTELNKLALAGVLAGDARCCCWWCRCLEAGDLITGDGDDDDGPNRPDDGPNGDRGDAASEGYGDVGNAGEGKR